MTDISIFTRICAMSDIAMTGFEIVFPEDTEWASVLNVRTEHVHLVKNLNVNKSDYAVLTILESTDFSSSKAIEQASVADFSLTIFALDTNGNPVRTMWCNTVSVEEVSVNMNTVDSYRWLVKLVEVPPTQRID